MQGDTLTSSAGSWSGSPTGYSYQWQDCNSSGATCVNIAGATSSSYTLTAGDVGDTIRSVVTATNTGGSTSATSVQTAPVADPPPAPPAPPANTAAPVVTGTAMQGDTLTTSTGSWSGSPAGYSYQWLDCNSSGAACANVAGATSSSYTLTAGDVGDTIRSIVTATNTGGSTAVTSAPTAAVARAGGGGVACDLTATTSSYSAVVAGATAGQTVCLDPGDYSGWTGYTGPTCCITVTAAPGAAVTFNSGLTLNLSTVRNFTLDGSAAGGTMTIGGGLDMETSGDALQNKVLNLTFQNITFPEGSNVVIDGPENSNIAFDYDTFINGNADDSAYPACTNYYSNGAEVYLTYSTSPITTPSGVTVENSTFSSFAVDRQANPNPNRALESGAPLTIEHNVIEGYLDFPSCNHIDGLQLYGGGSGNVTFVGNLCYDDFDCIGAFDITRDNTITDNVCYDIEDGCFELYSDTDSVVSHNTMVLGGAGGADCFTGDCTSDILLDYTNKSSDPASIGGVYENNIGGLSNDGTLATDTNNLFSGAGAPNIDGSPTFVGGASPSTWAGFELAPSSPGHLAATDGTDVGIRPSAGFPPGG